MKNFKLIAFLLLLSPLISGQLNGQIGQYGGPINATVKPIKKIRTLSPAEKIELLKDKVQLLVEFEFLFPDDKEVRQVISNIRHQPRKWIIYLDKKFKFYGAQMIKVKSAKKSDLALEQRYNNICIKTLEQLLTADIKQEDKQDCSRFLNVHRRIEAEIETTKR